MANIEKAFKRELSRFMKAQKNEFIDSKLIDKVYDKYPVRKEWISKTIDREFDFRTEDLHKVLVKYSKLAYNNIKRELGEPIVKSLPKSIDNRLMGIAEKINGFTKSSLVNKINKSVKSKMSISKAHREVRELIGEMEDYRADRIMKSEMTRATNLSFMNSLKAVGAGRKKWIDSCGEGCKTCKANEKAGWIKIDKSFPSGEKLPPQHPSCDCVIVGGK